MLTELSLQQFRAHASTTIPLGRLTVLVGPNGSGKSSVLEAIHILGRYLAATRPDEEIFVGAHDLKWLLRRGATSGMKIQVSGMNGAQPWAYWFEAPAVGDAGSLRHNWGSEQRGKEGWEEVPPEGAWVLRSARPFRLDARRLAVPSMSIEEVPRMEDDGYGLATVLSALKLSAMDRFCAVEDAAQRIVPGLRALGFKRTRIEQQAPRALTIEEQKVFVQETKVTIGEELLLDFDDASGLPAHSASEGTLIILGILAALYGPAASPLVLLEDMERALHPKAQRDLVASLRAALAVIPELQIIATTHSPYLVDALQPEEVVVLARGPDGAVAARRLSEHPKAKLLDVLTTGEFWAAEGEDWVTAP